MQSATLRRIRYVSVKRLTYLKFCPSLVLSHPHVSGRDPDSPLGGAAAIPMAPLSLHCSLRMSSTKLICRWALIPQHRAQFTGEQKRTSGRLLIKNAFTQNTATHRAKEQWLVSKKRWGRCQNNLKTLEVVSPPLDWKEPDVDPV